MSKNQPEATTALYCRLSQEDAKEGESNSIANQKAILIKYAQENGFRNAQFFIDDGFSGVAFDRPGFLAMMEGVKSGVIKTIIVKDHSRLGRNRLVIGTLLEEDFERYGVRYIRHHGQHRQSKRFERPRAIARLVQRMAQQDHQPKNPRGDAV